MRHLIDGNIVKESRAEDVLCSLYIGRYFWFLVVSLALSACFPKLELQFLLVALISGFKWVVASIPRNENIIIFERR